MTGFKKKVCFYGDPRHVWYLVLGILQRRVVMEGVMAPGCEVHDNMLNQYSTKSNRVSELQI